VVKKRPRHQPNSYHSPTHHSYRLHSKITLEKQLFKVANVEAHIALKDFKHARYCVFSELFKKLLALSNTWCGFSKTMAIVLKCNTESTESCIKIVEEALKSVDKRHILQLSRLKSLEIVVNSQRVFSWRFSAEERAASGSGRVLPTSL